MGGPPLTTRRPADSLTTLLEEHSRTVHDHGGGNPMLDFSLGDEERQIRDTIRSFITREVMPLEQEVLRNEQAGLPGLDHSVIIELQRKARTAGFWGINTPEEYGGIA